MFEKYKTLKNKIEALPEIQGVFYRVYGNEVQYIIGIYSFTVFKDLVNIIPKGWRMDSLTKQHLFCISYLIDDEEINKQFEQIQFP